MQVKLVRTTLALRDSTTRLPFRYGQACLTWCPQAILCAEVEVDGRVQRGYSGDCLPPSWFDKSPDKDYDQQIREMIAAIQLASSTFADAFSQATPFFCAWFEAQAELHRLADRRQWPGLLASFGVSMVERAMLDGIARAKQTSFGQLIKSDLLQIDAGSVHRELLNCHPQDWLPAVPQESVFVRHTVGLADPLSPSEVGAPERLADGQPQSLEEYIKCSGIRFLKIKVRNQLAEDLERLETIANIVERNRATDYCVTLDGNEQYHRADDFDRLVDGIQSRGSLTNLWRNTILIEQPLARDIALLPDQTHGIRQLSQEKPVIVDESDESLNSYPLALELGYRGVSSKACKGPLKSVLNAGLNWHRNRTTMDSRAELLMTGEDLCCVGIVPLQTDLCLVATLGLTHVERNGHHYHNGLSYLPASQQAAALERHPDLYTRSGSCVRPMVRDGKFQIASLQCVGFGFDVVPDIDAMKILPEDGVSGGGNS